MADPLHLEDYDPRVQRRRYRSKIRELFGGHCAYCGVKPPLGEKITIDHVIPKHKGGMDVPTNLLPACNTCNLDKSDTHVEDWYFRQSFFSESRWREIQAVLEGVVP